jgi:CheY-like chemotaxis protein
MAQYAPVSFADTSHGRDSHLAGIGNDPPQPMKYSVLLADDDPAVRESLRKLLHAEGYQVVLAANGADALGKFRSEQNPIDLVLLDLNMPLKNGWATLDRLVEFNPGLPVIILTGLADQHTLAQAAGVSALVDKPVDVPALLQLMKELLAEPVLFRLQGPARAVFGFHHLRAAGWASRGLWREPQVASYAHGGINE